MGTCIQHVVLMRQPGSCPKLPQPGPWGWAPAAAAGPVQRQGGSTRFCARCSLGMRSSGGLTARSCLPQFPVPPERDHLAMLASMNRCSYESPSSLSRGLSLLLSEVTPSCTRSPAAPSLAHPPSSRAGWPSPSPDMQPGLTVRLSLPSSCAETPCGACTTSTTSRATSSSGERPGTPSSCRSTRWTSSWPHGKRSRRPWNPPSPLQTLTVTSWPP